MIVVSGQILIRHGRRHVIHPAVVVFRRVSHIRRIHMSMRRLGLAAIVGVLGLLAPALADEPVLLRYKLGKGDKLIYKTSQETKQTQNIAGTKIETTTVHDSIMLRE